MGTMRWVQRNTMTPKRNMLTLTRKKNKTFSVTGEVICSLCEIWSQHEEELYLSQLKTHFKLHELA